MFSGSTFPPTKDPLEIIFSLLEIKSEPVLIAHGPTEKTTLNLRLKQRDSRANSLMHNSATSAELSEGLQLMQGGGFEELQQLRRALHHGTCSASTAPPNEPRVGCTWFRIVRKPRVDRRKMCADSFANSLIALSG
jgi:hypothetical protein